MKLFLLLVAFIGERVLAGVIIPRSPRVGLRDLAEEIKAEGEIIPRASCTCGVKSFDRIVNGNVATKNEYPWQVALCYWSPCTMDSQFCGGTVINDRYILTASHCTEDMAEHEIVVSVGDHDLNSQSESPSREFNVEKIIMHKGYDKRTVAHDIALLKLDGKITVNTETMSDVVSPICLPPTEGNGGSDYTGEPAYVTGWGLTSTNGQGSPLLREVELTVISNQQCQRSWAITKNQLCATEPNKDSCQGDSGGPLIHKNNNGIYEQIGVVSYGEDCASPVYPGVYTRVSRYIEWIRLNTMDANYCYRTSHRMRLGTGNILYLREDFDWAKKNRTFGYHLN